VGGVAVGMFHLITHAFFKALLFMGAGSVIHGCHEEQDIRDMGGLKKHMPITFATYAVGMLALSGFPLLFSGFWSKDEILHAAHGWPISRWPFYLGAFGALLTAFYMTRQVCYVFFGSFRSSRREEAPSSSRPMLDLMPPKNGVAAAQSSASQLEPPHAGCYVLHESPAVMTVPLVILAIFSVLLGFIGTPAWPWFQEFLGEHSVSGGLGKLFEGEVAGLMLASSVIVLAGIGLGWWLYGRKPVAKADETDVLERLRPDIFGLLLNKYYVDDIYDWSVVRLNSFWAAACDWLDRTVWNSAVFLVSHVILVLSWVSRFLDDYVVNLGFDETCRSLSQGGGLMSRLQDGRVQNYLRAIGLALMVLVLILVWGCRAS